VLVRRLEIQGFKSFAERVVVEFDPGSTGIVGPNGTGKSNIIDALRWSLGEQNPRMLRSTRMEDLIFSGSETRKPLGFSEVILTIDNESGVIPLDFAEISVTRRLYRSGESEYLLNGSPTRLKDISDLLSGTCLGRDGYSLVGQGRIDEVLLSTAEGRRGLFDEACGIGLHRGRKREALARLEDVAGRLERVSDVTAELESQLAPLDQQAEVARAFVGFRDELERLELWLEAEAVTRTRARMAACRERLSEAHGQSLALRDRESRLEEETRTLRAARDELGLLVEHKQREASLSEASLRQLTSKIGALERTIADRDREATLLREERGRLRERLTRAMSRQAETVGEASSRAERRAAVAVELMEAGQAEVAARQAVEGLRTAVETAKTELLEAVSQAATRRYEASASESEMVRLETEQARLAREAESDRRELEVLTAEAARLAGRLAEVEPAARAIAGDLSELESREASLASSLSALGREAERRRESFARSETERASLEATIGAAGAWSRSALAVTAAREAALSRRPGPAVRGEQAPGSGQGSSDALEWSEGFVGILGEELDVAPADRPALEAALGRYVDALIVRSEADLRRHVTFLKKRNLGPAVIVPLDLATRHLSRHGAKGGAGLVKGGEALAERVRCSAELRPAVDYLLGDILLVGDYSEAMDAVANGRCARAVTREGLLVREGGAVILATSGPGSGEAVDREVGSGGPGEPRTLMSMRRLREVRADIDALRTESDRLSSERETAEETLGEVRRRRSRLSAEAQRLAVDKATLSSELAGVQRREAILRQRVDGAGVEEPEFGQRLLLLRDRIRDLSDAQRRHTADEEKRRAGLSVQETGLRVALETLTGVGGRLSGLRVAAATLEEQERAGAAEAARLADDVNRLVADEAKLDARVGACEKESGEARAEMEPLRRQLGASGLARAGPGGDIEAWQRRRREMSGDLGARESELADLRVSLQEMAERERREETRLARLEAEEEMTVRRLRRDFGDDWEPKAALAAQAVAGLDGQGSRGEDSGRSRVEELRRAMSGLGVVNIGAIEERRRLAERITFLRDQANDLVEARDSLLRLMAEMDETMARKFEEGFLAIRRAFRQRIPALFGGGRGDLLLTNRDSLLESGIEILVEPPSKRLQSLALLSAGERALSALALLLSFLEVRPSPFVVLDEIDAPLDDLNVTRFCAAVSAITSLGQTQFVIVTHNKATMEIADSLYGVTMGEDGVSRLVSVKLEDRDKLRRGLEREAS
jgi:chromosome segregation protein